MRNRIWTESELTMLREQVAKSTPVKQMASLLKRSEASIRGQLQKLNLPAPGVVVSRQEKKGVAVKHEIELPPVPEFGARLPLETIDSGDWFRYGLVGDTHLCCKEERLAELHCFYDLLQAEKITTVFHAGNIIDGYLSRINGESVYESTIDGQSQYVADNYPSRPGITTYFITGDDHESWFSPGFNIGAYIQHVCEMSGRTDLKYIGHVEADVELKGDKASTIIKIQHPGGGSAYSRSYKGQKQVEALEGGEKPAILVQGHYHVSNFMNERNIHVVNLPGFQDQTIFARKKCLRMEVGGAILEFKRDENTGAVTRCRLESVRYFTRAYYKRYLKSDCKLIKGRLVLDK